MTWLHTFINKSTLIKWVHVVSCINFDTNIKWILNLSSHILPLLPAINVLYEHFYKCLRHNFTSSNKCFWAPSLFSYTHLFHPSKKFCRCVMCRCYITISTLSYHQRPFFVFFLLNIIGKINLKKVWMKN